MVNDLRNATAVNQSKFFLHLFGQNIDNDYHQQSGRTVDTALKTAHDIVSSLMTIMVSDRIMPQYIPTNLAQVYYSTSSMKKKAKFVLAIEVRDREYKFQVVSEALNLRQLSMYIFDILTLLPYIQSWIQHREQEDSCR